MMTLTLTVLLSVTSLFAVFLAAKSLLKIKICPLCAGVFITWTALLVMSWLGYAVDRTIVAVLVGESVVGLYHLAEKKFKEEWGLFFSPSCGSCWPWSTLGGIIPQGAAWSKN